MSDLFDIRDRRVLIACGVSGLGAAIASEVITRGARVAVVDIGADHADPWVAALRDRGA